MAMDDSHQYQPPNVIVIVAHDLGDYLGCYGHTVNTPNLDRMATQGVRFANHFSTASLCSPSRGSIITGKYPHTNGLMGLCNLGWELPIDNITDAQRFADAGYHTHPVGFQHETKANNSLGFQNNYDMSVKGGHNYATDIVAEFAGDLLQTFADEKEGSNEPQPFYIRMGMFSVHRAISAMTGNYGYDFSHANGIDESKVDVMPQWKDTPQLRQDLTGFTGDVNNMDRGVGILLDALDKSEFAQNTIVVFTTDHGIQYPFGKCSLYDLGIRTAMIVRYPQRFNAGTVIDAISS
ncbi:MAG: sulfatase-like hydrolase/transferase, partial [Phycisphaeraceae bacterium]|nr:sulfatase-like hydrolase/transferase [Phycisphaeraceae bacterium]